MIVQRKHIRKVALGAALLGSVCLTLSSQPDAVEMSIDLFFLVAVLFLGLLQDKRFERREAVAAIPPGSLEA